MAKVKCPRKLDISVFYQLTGRLPHEEGLNYDDERLSIHFYDNFCNESIKLLGKMVRCRTNVLYNLLKKIGKEPNADLFQFMKGAGHQRTKCGQYFRKSPVRFPNGKLLRKSPVRFSIENYSYII